MTHYEYIISTKMKNFIKGICTGALVMVSFTILYSLLTSEEVVPVTTHDAKKTIVIVDKNTQKLTVYDPFIGPVKVYDVSTGENPGNKIVKGDLKTPEGIFPVVGIEDASDWTYDFKDGNGPVEGAYGPYFIRLKTDATNVFNNVETPFKFTSENQFTGIGIHGTHLNNAIGSRASHGCIRLRNEDLLDLKKYLEPGSLVAIIPGKLDFEENAKLK
jgi:lipoprotein-anchoring transpeptidase ErfK/SrfK